MPEPGIFGIPPGADFPRALMAGLLDRTRDQPPEALARVTVLVNTRRMERRIRALFDEGPARLLPRIRLITDIGADPVAADLPPSAPPLRRRLELTRLVSALIEAAPHVAPEAAAFDLAESLAALLDEMEGEGVALDDILSLDVSDQSGHWARSIAFLGLIRDYVVAARDDAPDPALRLRRATDRLIAKWDAIPPDDPVIVAGSTGSRGTTFLLMQAVAKLPGGTLLLPGFDFDMPKDVWTRLIENRSEDHPQYRYARLAEAFGISPWEIPAWPGSEPVDPARNRLLSLSLRPAPVTDQWLRDGPDLGDLEAATARMTLVEAPGSRSEAQAIALMLRQAAGEGRQAALVSPDRMLTRRVAALLDRWGIVPDDSAGSPLSQSPPGRLLRQVADLHARPVTGPALLALLKHPLVAVEEGRGDHLLQTQRLELYARRDGMAFADRAALHRFGETETGDADWAAWVADVVPDDAPEPKSLAAHTERWVQVAEMLTAGPARIGGQALWDKAAGRKAFEVVQEIERESGSDLPLSADEFALLVDRLLGAHEVREPETPDPRVMIWGTLEARVQGADLVILGGLNEGTWPESPAPDPWLSRGMRREAGLLMPDRRIGLSAHDYQQAAAAPEVVLSRAMRDTDSEPVPSRWLNRLTNLLDGLRETGGKKALAAMRARGQHWVDLGAALDRDSMVPAAPRPSPRPPAGARPRSLSVTAIEKLIRDPYAIYAREILGLRALDPLNPEPDAALRGQVLHRIFQKFFADDAPVNRDRLITVTREVLAEHAPWPMIRRMWEARIDRVADWFLAKHADWSNEASWMASEVKGAVLLPEVDFTLRARADRIDRFREGQLAVLDYKTGKPPGAKVMAFFDKQLVLEAIIAEAGGFRGIDAAPVGRAVHIGLGTDPVFEEHTLVDDGEQRLSTATIRAELLMLIAAFDDPSRGYPSRRAMEKVRYDGDYDHLARFGEWSDSDVPEPENVGDHP